MFWLAALVGLCNGVLLWAREFAAREANAAESVQNETQHDPWN
jgi:hypothetical protein